VVIDEAPFVVVDARTDPLLADNPVVTEDGVVAYLGVPLRAPDGEVLGALCAVVSSRGTGPTATVRRWTIWPR